ncbi:gluconate 2-dehydrogenase (acceptor) [Caballeronia fortuita]|uniref:Gluconate 2-dehydrogenase (Acceptor) n=1 Tax=Caballeronia fortuita TaxID=1777138 RepID=A0A158AUR7_9BURK|nr:c-type cytochrome [Caballeronia fortuita]SAK61400.1 gluconate 2-dehydrogenase (acceptor) [Caballeronia fortuita]
MSNRTIDSVDIADAPPHAGTASAEPTTHRARTYRWPAGEEACLASLEVSVDATPSGLMRSYRYRVSLDGPGSASEKGLFAPDWRPASPQSMLYRHAHASLTFDSPAPVVPEHAHVFARESFMDETASELALDPVDLRLRHLDADEDAGAREVVRMVTERAAWGRKERTDAGSQWLGGRGFAMDGEREGEPNWSAWIVDIDVHRQTGDVAVRRVVAGYGEGSGSLPVLHGVPHTLVERAVSLALGHASNARPTHDEAAASAPMSFDIASAAGTTSLSTQGTPDALPTPDAQRAAAPAVAAIANAIFDATGVRFRQPPFDSQHLRSKLAGTEPPQPVHHGVAAARPGRIKRLLAGGGIAGVIGGMVGLACAIIPGPREIAPIAPGSLGASTWSAATLERGRQIALVGDCAVCHTAPEGQKNAGGFALETPFGTIYSTNITPDAETGIGLWSYAAFERAMRKGIARDGTHLYPAFPYTAFARMSEPDMLALYAYLMSQPAVKHTPPKTSLPFPMNLRPAVAGWNWLFHDDSEFKPDASKSAMWNRGKYLVDGAAHCGACHTPRNRLGAEKGGLAYLAGGEAEGWDAPALVGHRGPVPWTEKALFDYLRTGFSKEHGVAAGPMGPVVAGLAELPEPDVKAIAHYITSLSPKVDEAAVASAAQKQSNGADVVSVMGLERGRQTFETACAVCHAASGGVGHLGVRPLMGLNTSVAQSRPDNLLHVLHNGIDSPATAELGYMPRFGDVYDDKQMAELAAYIRARYAPDQPAWADLERVSAQVREAAH